VLALAAISIFPLKVFLLPTQEVRYYFPEITMALLAMAIGAVTIVKTLRFGSDRAHQRTLQAGARGGDPATAPVREPGLDTSAAPGLMDRP
jgi:alkylation response protein AidB-like acyl-CoA dehydrogenase